MCSSTGSCHWRPYSFPHHDGGRRNLSPPPITIPSANDAAAISSALHDAAVPRGLYW